MSQKRIPRILVVSNHRSNVSVKQAASRQVCTDDNPIFIQLRLLCIDSMAFKFYEGHEMCRFITANMLQVVIIAEPCLAQTVLLH